ncbi:PTS mannitol transporter subunit IIA [Aerococcaceae bacterium DSM 109653]|uniref:Mannitol-specific phosphotransferase enzyme IIA component n=1 Tax=Fundicoccus ignavus TaxID=2664442 RepID=A0A6I2GCY0_9LACT|nr:PTS sugar transporter subunit IIA [Fundicoccus ignavus]MRI82112.1 PTS mannitol transporter subunit IIA [Fundicoccus ignavus]MRI85640.1 PTS mannitol transporter subunit IIA [Fundicoccus ignavus]
MELNKEMIKLKQTYETKEAAIRAVGELLVANGAVEPSYIDSMLERERIVTTHMGNFVAIPHGTDEGKQHVKKTAIALVTVPYGVDFAPNDVEEKLAMVVFGIAGIGNEHLDLLAKIAVFCSDVDNVVRLADATTEEEVIAMLEEAEA